MSSPIKVVTGFVTAWMATVGCSPDLDENTEDSPWPTVYTVNYPLAYFAERIAGSQATVVFPDMAGDPASWTPGAEELVAYQNADFILLNGASYAKWVSQASLPQSRLVNTSAAFKDRLILAKGMTSHRHGPGGEHAHGTTAFTTWLDLDQAVQQAAAIDAALATPQSGFAVLKADLLTLDEEWKEVAAELAGTPLVGSHPVYQYLARRYELDLRSVHWEPNEEPRGEQWSEFIALLAEHPAEIMLWESEPLPKNKERLDQWGIYSVVFDPCANRPDKGNFLTVMRNNAANLRAAVSRLKKHKLAGKK